MTHHTILVTPYSSHHTHHNMLITICSSQYTHTIYPYNIPIKAPPITQHAQQQGDAAQEELRCLTDDLALLLREHQAVRVGVWGCGGVGCVGC